MTAEATASLLLATKPNELGIRVRVIAHGLPDSERPPLDLGLVLDTSGSMDGAAIDAVRASAREIVGKLRDGDRLSIVAFHSRADVLVPNTVVSAASRPAFERAIAAIQAKGTTDLADGLALGLAQVLAGRLPTGINRIVLLSDGVPNTAGALPQIVANIQSQHISVTSLGLGVDYDTTLMAQIATDTGGAFHYLEKPEEVAAVFDDELTKMTTVVGRDLVLVLEPGPGVSIQPLPGLTAAGDGKIYAAIGDLAAGEARDLMIPIVAIARGDGSTAELVQATLGFDDVIGKSGHQTRDAFVSAKTSADGAQVKAAVKVGLEVARIRATAAGAVLEAIALARQGQVEPAKQRLALAIGAVRVAAKRLGDAELDQLVKELDELSQQLAQIVPAPAYIVGDAASKPVADMPEAMPSVAPAAVEPGIRKAQDKAYKAVRGVQAR